MIAPARLYVQPLLDYTQRPVQVPYFSASFTESISRDVGWSVVLDAEAMRDMGLDLRPWRAAVYLRVGDYLVGGITGPRTWDRRQETASGRIACRGFSWMGWLRSRVIFHNTTHTAVEQFDIVQALLDYAQTGAGAAGQPGADLGVELVREPEDSGVVRDRTWLNHEMKAVGEAITDMGQVIDGFDWLPEVAWDDTDTPRRILRVGHLTIGQDEAYRPVVVDGSGAKVESEDYDHAEAATRVHAVGGPTNVGSDDRIFDTETAVEFAGLPLLDKVTSYDTVTNPVTLALHAQADMKRAAATRSVSIVLLDQEQHPPQAYRPGDRIDVSADHPGLHDELANAGTWRIISRTINADTQGLATQSIEVVRNVDAATPGPWHVKPTAVARWRAGLRRKRLAELEAKVGGA